MKLFALFFAVCLSSRLDSAAGAGLILEGRDIDFRNLKPKTEVVGKMKAWIELMKERLPDECSGMLEQAVEPKLALVRPVPCHEEGAIDRYSFSGSLDENLKMTGEGVLKIGKAEPVMQRCIKVLDLFGERIATIESDFVEGFAFTRAALTFRKTTMKAEVQLKEGMPQGIYRVQRDGIYGYGHLQSAVVKGSCWIILPDSSISGSCENDPWTLSRANSSEIQVYTHDFNVAISGRIFDTQEGKNLLMAQDFLPSQISGVTGCWLQLGGNPYGRAFEYDLDSHERNYFFENPYADMCASAGAASNGQTAEGDKDVSEAILTYLTSIKEIRLDSSPIDAKRAKKFISYLEKSVPEGHSSSSGGDDASFYEAVFTLHESVAVEFFYYGKLDEEGRFHGQAIIKPSTYQSCFKGVCKVSEFGQIFGTFEHGLLQGLVVVQRPAQDGVTFFVAKDGIAHSVVIEIGLRPIYPYKTDITQRSHDRIRYINQNGVGYMGIFRNGRPEGAAWYGLIGEPWVGQGFLYGQLNKKGKLTGDNIAYIYPDYLTALLGKFEDKIMKSAREVKITQVTCRDGLLQAKFSQPDESSVAFFYDRATNESIGSPELMLARDPYEKRTVELQESLIPGAGHGLFALRDIPNGQVVAIYNGMVYDNAERNIRVSTCTGKDPQSVQVSKRCMKYRINGLFGALYDIPEELDDINVYNATLAQKTNNNFQPFINTHFGNLEHPRFGLVVTVSATRDIKKGEEILVNYGYGKTARGETDWYFDQKAEVDKLVQEMREKAEAEMKLKAEANIQPETEIKPETNN